MGSLSYRELRQHYLSGGLWFNPVVKTVIVRLRPKVSEFPCWRLYCRSATAKKYRPLGEFGRNFSCDTPVTCFEAPFLYFNFMEIKADKMTAIEHKNPVSCWGMDWIAVHKADLRNNAVSPVFERKDFKKVSPEKNGWVAGLISASNDGKVLYVTIGWERPLKKRISINGRTYRISHHIDYYICRLELAAHRIHKITVLKEVFY